MLVQVTRRAASWVARQKLAAAVLRRVMQRQTVNEVYCYICDGHDHVNHSCPVLKLPKPVAHAVGYSVAGLGVFHIPHVPLPKKKESKNALVTVVGGSISREQLVQQLQRIVPG
jgi:hypothetical protein